MSNIKPSTKGPYLPTISSSKTTRSILSLRKLLGSTLRISINDSAKRIFLGTFVCTDKARNIVLANAEEFRLTEPERLPGSEEEVEDGRNGEERLVYQRRGRYVGMIMIPWKYILDVEEESISSLSTAVSQWII